MGNSSGKKTIDPAVHQDNARQSSEHLALLPALAAVSRLALPKRSNSASTQMNHSDPGGKVHRQYLDASRRSEPALRGSQAAQYAAPAAHVESRHSAALAGTWPAKRCAGREPQQGNRSSHRRTGCCCSICGISPLTLSPLALYPGIKVVLQMQTAHAAGGKSVTRSFDTSRSPYIKGPLPQIGVERSSLNDGIHLPGRRQVGPQQRNRARVS